MYLASERGSNYGHVRYSHVLPDLHSVTKPIYPQSASLSRVVLVRAPLESPFANGCTYLSGVSQRLASSMALLQVVELLTY